MSKFSLPLNFRKLCPYLSTIGIFTYNVVFERDLACTCRDQSIDCGLYMALPFFILFVLYLWLDKKCQRTCRFTCMIKGCTNCRENCKNCWENCKNCCENCKNCWEDCKNCCEVHCTFFFFLCSRIFKAAFLAMTWVIFLLIDGDWWVCCNNDGSGQQAQLACKGNTTAEDKVIIAQLKNKSAKIGLSLLFVILLVICIFICFDWRKCYESNCCNNRKILYDKVILEEADNVLKEWLKETAKEKLTKEITAKINGANWKECFDVAKNLIKNDTPPRQEADRPPPELQSVVEEASATSDTRSHGQPALEGSKMKCTIHQGADPSVVWKK